jgi:glycosyltransferase involved in cell wall biosynthesis
VHSRQAADSATDTDTGQSIARCFLAMLPVSLQAPSKRTFCSIRRALLVGLLLIIITLCNWVIWTVLTSVEKFQDEITPGLQEQGNIKMKEFLQATRGSDSSLVKDNAVTGVDFLNCKKILSSERPTTSQEIAPLVSIITTAHNPVMSLLIEESLSVFSQTLVNFEWILVNDFSSAPFTEEIMAFVKTDQRIVYVETTDFFPEVTAGNLGRARNAGVQKASAEFVFFLDSDDLIDPTTLEKMYYYLAVRPNAHFVNSYVVGFGAQQYKWQRSMNPSHIFATENVAAVTSLHRKESFLSIGGSSVRENGLEDWNTWLEYANAGKWGGTLPELLFWYRRRPVQSDKWVDFNTDGIAAFRNSVPVMYPRLKDKNNWPGNPDIASDPFSVVRPSLLPIAKHDPIPNTKSLVVFIPWMVLGGADRFNLVLLRALKARGWLITIITTLPSDDSWHDAFREFTHDIFILDHLGPASVYLTFATNIIASRNIDVVLVTNSFHGYTMLPYLREAFPKCAFVDYNHMEEVHWRNGGHPRSGVAMNMQLDLSLVASNHLKMWMVGMGADESKVHVAYVGVELNQWKLNEYKRNNIRKSMGFRETDKVVLYSCRFVDQKQPLLMAEIAVRILQEQTRKNEKLTHFLIVGSGPLQKDIEAIFNRNLHGALRQYVRIMGAVPYESMYDLMLASDINLLPSIMEGIPTTFFEAMALGGVIVGTDVGGSGELVVHGKTGFLVSPDAELSRQGKAFTWGEPNFKKAVVEYSDAILELCRDEALYMKMSNAAYKRIQSFDISITISKIDHLLKETIKMASATRANDVPRKRSLDAHAEAYQWATTLW